MYRETPVGSCMTNPETKPRKMALLHKLPLSHLDIESQQYMDMRDVLQHQCVDNPRRCPRCPETICDVCCKADLVHENRLCFHEFLLGYKQERARNDWSLFVICMVPFSSAFDYLYEQWESVVHQDALLEAQQHQLQYSVHDQKETRAIQILLEEG